MEIKFDELGNVRLLKVFESQCHITARPNASYEDYELLILMEDEIVRRMGGKA